MAVLVALGLSISGMAGRVTATGNVRILLKCSVLAYTTREDEIDRMLLVDLHQAFKQGVRASVEEYSPKKERNPLATQMVT